jgi:hypothetical protein
MTTRSLILSRLALFCACRGWRRTAAQLYLAAARAEM